MCFQLLTVCPIKNLLLEFHIHCYSFEYKLIDWLDENMLFELFSLTSRIGQYFLTEHQTVRDLAAGGCLDKRFLGNWIFFIYTRLLPGFFFPAYDVAWALFVLYIFQLVNVRLLVLLPCPRINRSLFLTPPELLRR